ncbi:MAG: hypothetical protein K1X29_08990 [Bdellovibrionales bacterium]|nr:hypothetical protein [Bdellovibrionales bacterium]
MFNRAEIIHQNFLEKVKQENLPISLSSTTPNDAGLTKEILWDLFESQVMSRILDLEARRLKETGDCFYTISSSGHESNAVWGSVFPLTDMAFVHYRSCAFMMQRSKQLVGSTPLYDTMLSYMASSEDPIAGGRHKVFGSYPLNVPPQTSTIASHLPKAVGTALSIGKAKDLKYPFAKLTENALVLCSFGDASANHSTAVGAINSSLWIAHQNIPLPLIFICEDNGIGISVPTPSQWIESQYKERPGLYYLFCDGLNICDVYHKAKLAEQFCRSRKKPVFLHMKTVRLLGHAGSDMEVSYRSLNQIEQNEKNDPLLHTARTLIENKWAHSYDILNLYEKLILQVQAIGKITKTRPKYLKSEEVRSSLTACQFPNQVEVPPNKLNFIDILGREASKLEQPQHLAKMINFCLYEMLLQYPGALIFGEDVAQKGGVYNVTDGLWRNFGPRRVFNSLLDEQTILGSAIGLAHNGFLPIPEIQFLAYVHNAEDQIRGEAATLAFFSQGQYTNGMVVRVAGLPYQKGFGGHFHNDNSLAIFRDIPGVIIAVPSNGEDAVKMFRTCMRMAWEQGRVVIFVEPIALYMTKDLHQPNDKQWSFHYPWPRTSDAEAPLGQGQVYGSGKDLVILTYGNGYYLSRQALPLIETQTGMSLKIVDLRWLAPIDEDFLKKSIGTSTKVLIVDECRKTGSISEWLTTFMVEHFTLLPKIKILAADDCFIPLGPAAAAGLPSRDQIVSAAVELLSPSKNNFDSSGVSL